MCNQNLVVRLSLEIFIYNTLAEILIIVLTPTNIWHILLLPYGMFCQEGERGASISNLTVGLAKFFEGHLFI